MLLPETIVYTLSAIALAAPYWVPLVHQCTNCLWLVNAVPSFLVKLAVNGAASAIELNVYTIVSGSNIVPISNSGSINHAVTDASGKFAVKLSNDNSNPPSNPVYFHVEVQGAVHVANSTVDSNSPS